MINIELKVSAKDFKDTVKNLKKIGAFCDGNFYQKDTYYHCRGKRLKIREIDHKIYQLIIYKREDRKESKISDYSIKNLNKEDLKHYKRYYRQRNGESIQIIKQRALWRFKNTRIHLDRVRGLGKFIELETIVKDPKKMESLQKEHREIINLLSLFKFKKISKSYNDLLIEKENQRKILTSHLIQYPKTFPI